MIGHNFQLFVYIFKKCFSFFNFLVVGKMHYFHEKKIFFRENLIFHGESKRTNYYV